MIDGFDHIVPIIGSVKIQELARKIDGDNVILPHSTMERGEILLEQTLIFLFFTALFEPSELLC